MQLIWEKEERRTAHIRSAVVILSSILIWSGWGCFPDYLPVLPVAAQLSLCLLNSLPRSILRVKHLKNLCGCEMDMETGTWSDFGLCWIFRGIHGYLLVLSQMYKAAYKGKLHVIKCILQLLQFHKIQTKLLCSVAVTTWQTFLSDHGVL